MKFCTSCGAQIADDARFCTVCGSPASPVAAAEPTRPEVAPTLVPVPSPTPIVTPTPAPVRPRSKRWLWVVAALVVGFAVLVVAALGVLTFVVFTPQETTRDLVSAVNAGDARAAERLLTPDLAGALGSSGGVLGGLEASQVGEFGGRLDKTSADFTAAEMTYESDDAVLRLALKRTALGWKVASVTYTGTETVTEDIEPEYISNQTEALPSGTTLKVAEGFAGSRDVTRQRTVINGSIDDSVIDETVLAEPEPAIEWVGTGSLSYYADNVSNGASGDYINRSTWIVDDPKEIVSSSSSEVAASFTIDPITSDMVFDIVWLEPDGTEYWSPDSVYPDSSWTYINVGWWNDDVQVGNWAACLMIDGEPADYVEFTVE